jgi:predicted DNA-binding protein
VTTQLVVRIDDETKKKFMRLARMEGKTGSDKVREMVNEYVTQNDLPAIVDGLWARISKKLDDRGVTEKDVERTVKAVRRTRRR